MAFVRHIMRQTGVDITRSFMSSCEMLGLYVKSSGPFSVHATAQDSVISPVVVQCGNQGFVVIFRGKLCAVTHRVSVVVFTWCALVLKYLGGLVPIHNETGPAFHNISAALKDVLGIHEALPCVHVGDVTSLAVATRGAIHSSHIAFPGSAINASMMWRVAPVPQAHPPHGAQPPDTDPATAHLFFQKSAEAFIKATGVAPDAMGSLCVTPAMRGTGTLAHFEPAVRTSAADLLRIIQREPPQSHTDAVD